ncbi:hypothetical protein SAMN05444008_108165 [Cnuella takakiae]|uniref:Uncharacterized protein n=1 Tax=Cnuella takakiae TaxID=1302690 RepID=A0A1M5BZI9_9BACT|nr:hypothetical protein SAMN05444008_108165 [Cnuella takakiae]
MPRICRGIYLPLSQPVHLAVNCQERYSVELSPHENLFFINSFGIQGNSFPLLQGLVFATGYHRS